MSTTDVVDTDMLKARIIEKVKTIHQQKLAKKNMMKSFGDNIKQLEEELDVMMAELDEAQRAQIEADADEILKADAQDEE